jgi:hypothetical protein
MLGRRPRRAHGHRRNQFGDLRAGIDRLDALHRERSARVDRTDAAVRDIAALEGEMLHAGNLHVVDVRRAALNKPRIFAPLDALTHEFWQDR